MYINSTYKIYIVVIYIVVTTILVFYECLHDSRLRFSELTFNVNFNYI